MIIEIQITKMLAKLPRESLALDIFRLKYLARLNLISFLTK